MLLLTLWGLRVIKKRWGFPVQYYVVVTTTALLTLSVFYASATLFDNFPILGAALAFMVIIMAFAALLLSVTAVFTTSTVPLLLSIPCLLASLLFSLFTVTIAVTGGGVGMVG